MRSALPDVQAHPTRTILAAQAGTGTPHVSWLTSSRATSLVLLVWWLVQKLDTFGFIGDQPRRDAVTATDQGSPLQVILGTSFALLGVWHLRRVGFQSLLDRPLRVVLVPLGIYLLWAFATLAWSIDPTLTLRRSVQLGLIVIGSLGLGVGFYGVSRERLKLLALHVTFAGAISQFFLWITLLSSGDVNFLDPTWSIKGVFGTVIAWPTMYSITAMLFLWSERSIGARIAFTYVFICFLTLFAQKVRTLLFLISILAFLQVVGVGRIRKHLVVAVFVGLFLITGVGIVLAVTVGTLEPVLELAWGYVSIGAADDTTGSLNGRTVLWDALWPYFDAQPLTGYGYGAFWNSQTIQDVQAVVKWSAVIAHNGYLDEALGTGMIGLGLFAIFWVVGLGKLWVTQRRGYVRFAGVAFAWLVLFVVLNLDDSLLQRSFIMPFYLANTGLFAVLAQEFWSKKPAQAEQHQPA
jgi:exopolysaccharide production protein ExoQ